MQKDFEKYLDSFSAGDQYRYALSSYQFWDNQFREAIPQTAVAKMVMDHLKESGDKKKKVAVIGYDGARADVLVNVLRSHQNEDSQDFSTYVSGHAPNSMCSGVRQSVLKGAKVYHSYAGGLKDEKTQQRTETAQGWASISTGVWADSHQVKIATDTKSNQAPSFMLQAAKNYGLRSLFAASWDMFFKHIFIDEMKEANENQISATFKNCEDDVETFLTMKEALTEGSKEEKDVVFCTFEATDWNGHATGFGNQNYRYLAGFRDEDEMAYLLMETILNRKSFDKEDWLIILTTDHGGLRTRHGEQSLEERSTWIVSNKEIPKKYWSKNYNGYQDK